jgi:hypothetical protein
MSAAATVLTVAAAIAGFGLASVPQAAASDENGIRAFRVNVPEEALIELRRHLQPTRWDDIGGHNY